MTAIGEWLKSIILIVMFAVIADLLLPNKEMQRYVRMVLGLAVIAAMLQPIGAVVQGGWADRLAESAASEVTGPTASTDSSSAVKHLQTMLDQEQSKEANRFLGDELKAQIVAKFKVKVLQVKVTGRTGEAPISVHVAVAAGTSSTRAIQSFVAGVLAVPEENVAVTVGGGIADGLEAAQGQ